MSEDRIKKEEQDSEANLFVVDPDDYQKTKKLELIHKSKQEVLKVRNSRMKLIEQYQDLSGRNQTGLDIYQVKLAKTISQYGSELLPLIEESLENGTIEDNDLKVSLGSNRTDMNVIKYIMNDGRIHHGGELTCPPDPNHLAIYRQLDRIQRKLGLGLELEEDKGPAEI